MLTKMRRKLSTTQIIGFGFLVAIFSGTLLLCLPIASKLGRMTSPIDALFTATSAICVTGLTTVVTLEHWNYFGQFVILLLIQFGGLGVVTVTTSILLLLHQRITLKERILIQDAFNMNTLGGLVKLTIKVLKGTLLVEAIGAILYSFQFIPEYGIPLGIWKSVFHSISAFCNAGIDIIGENSFAGYVNNPLINLTTMVLIVAGGIGFPVWWDLIRLVKRILKEKMDPRLSLKKMELHSKIAIVTTLALILGGAILIFILEFSNQSTIGDLGMPSKVMASVFQSVTTRTAGFLTISQSSLKESTAFLCIVLMFIGGSPSGTAGGIKTVTVAILIFTTLAVIKGKQETEVFSRKIEFAYCKKALAVACFSFMILLLSTFLLAVSEGASFIDTVFETTSAIATVGLSRGMTMELSWIGKMILIITMYLGRIGPITIALIMNPQKQKKIFCSLPQEGVLIG